MKIAVIGRGLWGAAAARHLARGGQDITLIGPDEPADKSRHMGAFGSHYDEGRITRKNALDPYWCGVSIASIDRYADIEAESGIRFFTQTGAMMAGRPDWMARVDEGRRSHQVECEILTSDALAARFPYFRFPIGFTGYFEPTRAGHLSPRRLVAAQTKAATRNGARVVSAEVQNLRETAEGVRVETTEGARTFDRVLVAAGYNTDHLLGRSQRLAVYARTVALFEVDPAEQLRLAGMPTLVWDSPDDPYLLPPIRYPDGKTYVKLGGDPEDVALTTQDDIHDWFRAGGDPQVRDHLHHELMGLMPDLRFVALSMASCVTSWTEDRLPEIGWQSDRIAVTTGGNGAGAKCSDEIGRLGAALILEEIGATV